MRPAASGRRALGEGQLTEGEVADGLVQLAQAVRSMQTGATRLRALFDHSPVGTALLRADGVVVEVNPALCRMLGRNPTALVGHRLTRYAHPDELDPLQPGRGERRFVHADGHVVWGMTSVVDVPDVDDGARLVSLVDVSGRRGTERMLLHAALHDSLTNVPNRRLLHDRLDTALARAERSSNSIAVLFVDLDDFKKVNDTLGHDAGDDVLVAVARNIVSVLRGCDTVARLGGDEFVVVCEDVSGEGDISRLARRVLEAIRRPVVMRGHRVTVTASIGVAMPGPHAATTDELIRLADLAMYRAKRAGDVDYVLADGTLTAPSSPAAELLAELRHAIQADELELHYQPVASVNGTLVGLEALLRWPHPRLGLLRPDDFLPVVAGTELAKSLSDWVLRTAIADAAALRDPGIRVSVNMWVQEIARPGFAGDVAGLLTWAGLPARQLYLEVHEQDLADAAPALTDELDQLRLLGVGLAVDDFGGSGSSLVELRRLPADAFKLDQALVTAACDDPTDAEIVRAIAHTARAAGRHPIAAGVETVEQLNRVRELGCTRVQGYLTGRPAPLRDLRDVIARRRVALTYS